MQNMLLGEADRTKDLMGDTSAFRCGFGAANFCRGRFEKCRFIKTVAFSDRVGGGTGDCKRSGGFSSKTREVLLHCLKLPDRSFEGDTLIGMLAGQAAGTSQGDGKQRLAFTWDGIA